MSVFIVNTVSSNEDYDAECNTLYVNVTPTYATWLLGLRRALEVQAAIEPAIHTIEAIDNTPVFFSRYELGNDEVSQRLDDQLDGEQYVQTDDIMPMPISDSAIAEVDYVNVIISGFLPLKPQYDGVQWECGPHHTDLTITSETIPWIEIEHVAGKEPT